jgi:hypothetical protein
MDIKYLFKKITKFSAVGSELAVIHVWGEEGVGVGVGVELELEVWVTH